VENQRDGSVKIRVCGSQEMCNQFIQWCRRGSGYSWVERLDIHEMPPEPFSGFTVRY
jgi:acylphosphatase